MNYLAHAYLSFSHPGTLAGNMISDFVKGRKKYDLPTEIQQGIELHRFIDNWTDQHDITKELKVIFKPIYGLYSAAIMDVVYDHFLATDLEHFKTIEALEAFSLNTYRHLEHFSDHFPERFARMFPYMREQNWLYHYHSFYGVQQSLGGLKRRALYIEDIHPAYELFEQEYKTIKAGYSLFFPDLYQIAYEEFLRITDKENV